MSEQLLFNTKRANFQQYHSEKSYISMRWCLLCTRPSPLVGFL